ncbi:MAG: zinc-binding alcohol dehydrogenase [Clostridia bacterium]|nr:zinc-binding alcohol dehydrogenase [Clostridia bacterium]MBQ8973321.1 zinc-binding alcohol dehydrogenase [Clostridia bacterium]
MNNRTILFEAPWKVSLKREEVDLKPAAGELLVETQYSLISTGTELACLSGGEEWFKMPAVPGYCCVSKVLEAGEGTDAKPGDMVFHYGMHTRYQLTSANDYNLIAKVPAGVELTTIPMVRMATIAFTAIRVSNIQLGDVVLVSGLGLVGIMAAQLAKLSGATVIGVDPAEHRRALARKVGIDAAVAPEEAEAAVAEIGKGAKCNTVIEATGIPACGETCLKYVGYQGEIIFLGTPRGNYQANLADVFRYSHLNELGCVTFKGAHEWRLPLSADRFVKHSIERNTYVCFDLIQKGLLKTNELVSHVVSPEEATEVYLKLHEDRNAYLGVIIDWKE